MKYSINGTVVSLESSILDTSEIDKALKEANKAVEAFSIISNVKAMESFGYKATEGIVSSIAAGAKVVVTKIKELIDKIVQFIKDIFTHGMVKNKAKKLLVKINASPLRGNDAFDFDKEISVSAGMILKTTSLPEIAKWISAIVSAFKADKNDDVANKVLYPLFDKIQDITGDTDKIDDFTLHSLGYKSDQDIKYFLKTVFNDNCYILTELKAMQETLTSFKNKIKETTEDDNKTKAATLNAIKAAYKLSKLGWNFIKVHMYVIEKCIVDPDSSKEKE